MQFLKIILLSTLAAIVYGIVHDLITAHVCVEYFSIAHPPILGHTINPILLALGWGVIATWWVGLPLGVLLALAARLGPEPRIRAGELVVPTVIGLAIVLILAMLVGAYAYHFVQIPPRWAARIPVEHHRRFVFDGAAHLTSYGLGAIFGLVLAFYTMTVRIFRACRKPPLAAPVVP